MALDMRGWQLVSTVYARRPANVNDNVLLYRKCAGCAD